MAFDQHLINEIAHALWSGIDVREIEERYGHIPGAKLALFLINEGGAVVRDDEALLEYLDQLMPPARTPAL